MNRIFLVVGRSGSGKTTIVEQLEQKYGLKVIQSYTTRPPRYNGETGHIFVSDEEFDKLTDFVGYTEFCGYRYCAVADQVETHDLYVIDPKGVEYFRNAYKGSKDVKVIYIDSPTSVIYERMIQRAVDSDMNYFEAVDSALARIENDTIEFADYIRHTATVDFTAINDLDTKIDDLVDEIYHYIVSCERQEVG